MFIITIIIIIIIIKKAYNYHICIITKPKYLNMVPHSYISRKDSIAYK